MAPNSKFVEIEAFLNDALIYFTRDVMLQSVDYQNTGNDFQPPHDNDDNSEGTRKSPAELLARCQDLLKWIETYSWEEKFHPTSPPSAKEASLIAGDMDDDGYLDMSSNSNKKSPSSTSTANCSSNSNLPVTNDYVLISPLAGANASDDKTIAGSCDLPKSNDDTAEVQNSPYAGLPAAHLTLQKSPKQGQLTRIEKRIFFDQSKKYFCGVVADWLLCYTDGPTSIKPTLCVHLTSGCEVDGYGEGKRRDLSFQITTVSGKRYIFQATSEIDAKAWIHAIEGTVRGIYSRSSVARDPDTTAANRLSIRNQSPINNNLRKLPTPPPATKRTYSNVQESGGVTLNDDDHSGGAGGVGDRNSDEIYEEPCPLYKSDRRTSLTELTTPNQVSPASVKYEEYDVPKPLNVTNPIETSCGISVESKVRSEIMIASKVKVSETDGNSIVMAPKTDTPPRQKFNIYGDNNAEPNPPGPLMVQNNSTPVRNWFMTRLNKSGGGSTGAGTGISNQQQQQQSHRGPSKNRLRPKNLKENFNSVHSSSGGQTSRILVASAKGEKVNMIVNKLVDANGRMPIFRGGGGNMHLNSSDCAVDVTSSQLICDDSNYELINAPFTKA